MTSSPVAQLARPLGYHIAYRRQVASGIGTHLPGVIFLSGFKSDMSGSKATALAEFCQARGQAFLCFDYFGHGQSGGDFLEGSIGRWRDDALAVLDQLTQGPQILIGSSMGGWLMLLTALLRPARIHGLVGIAAAPDFTEDLMLPEFSAAEQAMLRRDGRIARPSEYSDDPYIITWQLIEEARQHLLLRQPIDLRCPVRLLQGMADPDVPYQTALRLTERLVTPDVELHLIKDGDHRLSRPQDLALLFAELDKLSGSAR